MMRLREADYEYLAAAMFNPSWPGYKPDVAEAHPLSGAVDRGKRYAHLHLKYLARAPADYPRSTLMTLQTLLLLCTGEARQVAFRLGLPEALWPDPRYSTVRIIDYPPMSGAGEHTDQDLFTIHLWRDPAPGGFVRTCKELETHLDSAYPGLHLGEMAEVAGLGPATPHLVRPLPQAQRAIVFFAIPDLEAELLPGLQAGPWLENRMARARVPH
jgi:hypothetical protein